MKSTFNAYIPKASWAETEWKNNTYNSPTELRFEPREKPQLDAYKRTISKESKLSLERKILPNWAKTRPTQSPPNTQTSKPIS
ncbi:MAG: hypothetical protein CMM07_27340 [Rhodopirellula sp.]|nr:hypothetical protein [Rhodopirellula sp.]